MIYDTLDYLKFYLPLEIRDEVAVFVGGLNSDTPDGKYLIRDTDIYAQVSMYSTKQMDRCYPEVHRKYVDIQILLVGAERIYYCPLERLQSVAELSKYDAERDIQFFDGIANGLGHWLLIEPKTFAVFFPQDAHAPQCKVNVKSSDETDLVRKAVIKVNRCLWIER